MRKIIPVTLMAAALAAIVSTPAMAQTCNTQAYGNGGFGTTFGANLGGFTNVGYRGGNINGTQAQLQARINAGIASGALTSREAASLQSQLANINNLEARLRMTGGHLSFGERQRLQADLSRLSMRVQAQLTDNETRWNNSHRHGRFAGRNNGRWYR
jgi:hypothetical protein